jgi:hypothetical protein
MCFFAVVFCSIINSLRVLFILDACNRSQTIKRFLNLATGSFLVNGLVYEDSR